MIPDLNRLSELFEKMNANGFDTSKNHKWGYYFVDSEKTSLQKVYHELQDHGYILEGINIIDDSDEYQVFVTKVEILTPEKLHRRNVAFNELADFHSVMSYDGWDVEKLNK